MRTTYSWPIKSKIAQYKTLSLFGFLGFFGVPLQLNQFSFSGRDSLSYFLLSAVQHCYTEPYTLYIHAVLRSHIYVYMLKSSWPIRTNFCKNWSGLNIQIASQHLQRFFYFLRFVFSSQISFVRLFVFLFLFCSNLSSYYRLSHLSHWEQKNCFDIGNSAQDKNNIRRDTAYWFHKKISFFCANSKNQNDRQFQSVTVFKLNRSFSFLFKMWKLNINR